MNCYNCGKPLNKANRNKEHIPAKAYYVGYRDEFKINRITVPACIRCNEKYSKTDQELRNAIGISNQSNNMQKELTRFSISSIVKKGNSRNKLKLNEAGKVLGVEFDFSNFETTVIKDFKGIFYRKFGYPLPGNWQIKILTEFENEHTLIEASHGIYQYVNDGILWMKSGHEDIFKYKIKTFTPNAYGKIYDSDNLNSAISIASIQVYHNNFRFIVVATKNEYLKKNKKVHRVKKRRRNRALTSRKKRLYKTIKYLKRCDYESLNRIIHPIKLVK